VTEGESNVFRGFVLVLVSVSFGFAQVKFSIVLPPLFCFLFYVRILIAIGVYFAMAFILCKVMNTIKMQQKTFGCHLL